MPDPRLTLLFTAIVAGLSAAALFRGWSRNRAADGLLWWSASLALGSVGFLFFFFGGPSPEGWGRMFANYLALGASGAAYSGARRLNGASPNLLMLVAGPTLWLAFSAKLGSDFEARVTALSLLHAAYAFAAAFEFARVSAGRPVELRIASGVLTVVGLLHTLRAVTSPNIVQTAKMDPSLQGAWVAPMALISATYIVALAVLVLRTARKGGQLPDSGRSGVTGGRSRQSL